MSLWGATPVLAVALLGGAGHPALAPAQTPGATGPSLATTSAILAPVGADSWQTTVLLNNTGPSCPVAKGSYLLETSRPDQVVSASNVTPVTTSTGSKSSSGTCTAVTVTFGLTQAPQSAALEFGANGPAPSSEPLTVSRGVSLLQYLLVPALSGAVMVALLMLLILYVVRMYDWDGARVRPFLYGKGRKRPRRNRDFWHRTVAATGAWTVNDSWATNIATAVALLTAVLATTTAANSLFPGIALDRFSLVNVVAGGLVAAVPMAFGALYARWIERDRGITADCLIEPTMTLPANCVVKLQSTTTVAWRLKRWWVPPWLVQDQPLDLPAGGDPILKLAPTHGDNRCLVTPGGPLPEGTRVTLAAGAVLTWGEINGKPSRTTLSAALKVRLAVGTRTEPGFSRWVRIPPGGQVTIDEANARPGLAPGMLVTLSDGAIAKPDQPAAAAVNQTGPKVRLLGGKETRAILLRAVGDAPAGTQVTLPSGVQVTVCGLAPDAAAASAERATVMVQAPAGAVLTVPGGAIVGTGSDPGGWSTRLKAGGTVQVLPQSTIKIYAYPGCLLALPGGSDVIVAGESYFEITGTGGVLVIAADNLTPAAKTAPGGQDPQDPEDPVLAFPVSGLAPGGAKITVTGTAGVVFPAGMALTAPRRDDFTLACDRRVVVPQAAGALVANMWLVIAAALMTMFGVGAEVGVAGTLAFLSDAAPAGQWIIVLVIALVAVFTVYYGATSIRALADPQPGSSLSATSGSSFTL